MTKEELQALRGRVLQAKTNGQNVANLEGYITQLESEYGELDDGKDHKRGPDHLLALIFNALHPNAGKEEKRDAKADEKGRNDKLNAVHASSTQDHAAATVAVAGENNGAPRAESGNSMAPFSIPDASARPHPVPARAGVFPAFTIPDASAAEATQNDKKGVAPFAGAAPNVPPMSAAAPSPAANTAVSAAMVTGNNLPNDVQGDTGIMAGAAPSSASTPAQIEADALKAGQAKNDAKKAAKKDADKAKKDTDKDESKVSKAVDAVESTLSKAVDSVKSAFKSDEDDKDSDKKDSEKK